MSRAADARRLAAARRRRRILAVAVVLVACAALATILSAGGAPRTGTPGTRSSASRQHSPPPPPPQLPGGGRSIFPRYRVVAFYGGPPTPALGVLGIGTPDQAAARLRVQARAYRQARRPVLPALELIATVASGAPEQSGQYSYRQSDAAIERYLAAARRAGALLVLDIQPGHSPFMREVLAYQRFLEQPDVGLALDPEWDVPHDAIPGKVIGSVDAGVVNRVSAYLAALVRRDRLPQKLLLVHEFTDSMIVGKAALARRRGLALTINVDGVGPAGAKIGRYEAFASAGPRFHNGFKLFYRQDSGLMSPAQVLALIPAPEMIVYQ